MTPPPANPKTAVTPKAELPQPQQFTFDEYCAYDDGTENRYELVDGYLKLRMSPNVTWHFLVCEFLVYYFNQQFQKTGTPLWAAKEVWVRTQQNSCRIVDVCVDERERWQELFDQKRLLVLEHPPLLVVEVASTNEKEDYEAKYQEYAAIGISEYWIVSRKRQHIRVCHSTYPGGSYVYRDFVPGERIVSKVLPQLELTVDELLSPAAGQLIEQAQAQPVAAIEQARQQATVSEQRAVELEARLARYQAQFGNLEDDALDGDA